MALKGHSKKLKRGRGYIKFIPLSKHYIEPKKSDAYAIGFDVCAPVDIIVPAHSRILVPLGFGVQLPFGVECKIEPRSGFSAKGFEGYGVWTETKRILGFKIRMKRCGKHRFNADVIPGKIDPAFQESLNVVVKNDDVSFTIKKGTRIAQLTFYRTLSWNMVKADSFSAGYPNRGGGIGHSGTT